CSAPLKSASRRWSARQARPGRVATNSEIWSGLVTTTASQVLCGGTACALGDDRHVGREAPAQRYFFAAAEGVLLERAGARRGVVGHTVAAAPLQTLEHDRARAAVHCGVVGVLGGAATDLMQRGRGCRRPRELGEIRGHLGAYELGIGGVADRA